jgi:uncharacterized protein
MRILTVSDIHGHFSVFKLETLPTIDLVLIAGDLTTYGFYASGQAQTQAIREIDDARAWFKALSQRCQKIYWVQGNHDRGIPDSFLDPFAVNIRDQSVNVECNGVDFSLRGVSLTCAFDRPYMVKDWAYTTADPNEDAKAFDFGYHDIIVSHCPPLNCLDQIKSGKHIGSPALRSHILKHQPVLVLCGHVHEAAGLEKIGRTLVVNSAGRGEIMTLAEVEKEAERGPKDR